MKNKIFSKVFSSMLIVSTLTGNCLKAATQPTDVILNNSTDLNIVLNAGRTDVDYSNFEEDLKKLLIEKGVSEDEINITTRIGTSLTTNSFDWWIYDHTNESPVINDAGHAYIESQNIAATQYVGNYEMDGHITNEERGTLLTFHGYGTSGYKDFLYVPSEEASLKNFAFSLEEKEAHDALEGAGFLFNTSVTGSYEDKTQTMSGYLLMLEYNTNGVGSGIKLYSFENVNTKTFHNSNTLIGSYSGFKLLATAPYSSTDKFRNFKLVIDGNEVKLYYKGNATSFDNIKGDFTDSDLVTFTDKSTSVKSTSYKITNNISTGYGFGPIVGYRSHACARKTTLQFTNVLMTDKNEVSLSPELGKDVEDREFMINLNDKEINEFKNEKSESDLKDSLDISDTCYIGWGTDANKDKSLEFIEDYGNGDFVSSDDGTTYMEQLQKIADIIFAKYEAREEYITDITVGDAIEFKTYRNVELIGTDGAWTVVYTDEDGNENTTVQNDLSIDTNVAGTYKIYYKGKLLNTVNIEEELDDTPNTGVKTKNQNVIVFAPFLGITGVNILK